MTPESASKAPSEAVETTAGSEQRPDHTGVIRGADEAERTNTYLGAISRVDRGDEDHWVKFSTRRLIAATCMALADAENATLTAEVERLTRVGEVITATADRDCDRLERWLRAERVISDSRNATIDRLWAQLNEATNTPHCDPEFGFDKTAALSDPGEDAATEPAPELERDPNAASPVGPVQHECGCPRHVAYRENLAANTSAENEALRAEVASLRAFQLQHRRSL